MNNIEIPITYKALLVEEHENGFSKTIKTLNIADLHKSEVLIRVKYSSLNYKDALSASGNKGVTKNYPHTPGIDAAGIVVASTNEKFKQGDEVIVTGYDLGMNVFGGFGQYISVPASWIVPLPAGLSLKEAMILGTAGFTAGISLTRVSSLVNPQMGPIIVSGATGGVGSTALALLKKVGFKSIAISGKETEHDFLKSLGADEIISRTEFESLDKKPILTAKYAGGIDTVGGVILENMIKQTLPLGAITTCGSVGGTQINVSCFPFILRAVSLMGVSSQNYPYQARVQLWNRLASEWKIENLEDLCSEITLDELPNAIEMILNGKLKGRTIVAL